MTELVFATVFDIHVYKKVHKAPEILQNRRFYVVLEKIIIVFARRRATKPTLVHHVKFLRATAVPAEALNVDFNGVRFDPLGSRSPPYERIKFGYPLENVRFLLLWTNLARQWLQIDTDLLLIITSTADELSGVTNIDDLERP